MIVAVGNDAQFAKFCEVGGTPEWARDPRFATNAERVRHRAVIVPLIAEVMKTRTQRAWLDALEAAGRALRADQPARPGVRRSAVRRARSARCDLPHALAGTVPQVRHADRVFGDAATYDRPPPLLGEHTATVLRDRLGMSEGAIAALAARSVIQVGVEQVRAAAPAATGEAKA